MEDESFAMNGGDGLNSYKKNSKFQRQGFDASKILLRDSIQENFTIQNNLNGNITTILRIADLGCSVGPNTFACVKTIIEAVKLKFETHQDFKTQLPEFQVFFNDQVSNDFNTLFKGFPVDRNYMVAGVPGSFHGRLFPKASMNVMHTSFSLHWLSRVPEQVTKEGSPAWNKGRVSYVSSSDEVVEAFSAQFVRDMEGFFAARSVELVDDGLLALLIPCRQESTLPSDSILAHIYECVGLSLADMAKEGLVSEDLLDSFNVPIYIPSPSEVKNLVLGMKSLFSIERLEELLFPTNLSTPNDIRACVSHIRATVEGVVCKHFGSELNTEELFERYFHKIEEFSKTPRFTNIENVANLFMLVDKMEEVAKGVFGLALDNVGPNTFACVQTIIEAVKLKFKNQLPELHVFFIDHVANDFNTLFKAFLIDRTYMVARVPGRISYVSSSDEVVEAFGAQFESDAEGFFAARSAELVDDTLECLGCAFADMAKEVNLKQIYLLCP
ncbi:hypothetical protein ACFX19_017308 [Malus domestica]